MSATKTIEAEEDVIGDDRLRRLYCYWRSKRRGGGMPSRRDIDPVDIPGNIWPHILMLDVVWEGGEPRFRYRRVGDVFWRALGTEPTGSFVDDVLPETAGYRKYILEILGELAHRRRSIYTENIFALDGQSVPMITKRVNLPLSSDGETVDKVLTGHVFDYPKSDREDALSMVTMLKEITRVWL
jgi:hypothetical protein